MIFLIIGAFGLATFMIGGLPTLGAYVFLVLVWLFMTAD